MGVHVTGVMVACVIIGACLIIAGVLGICIESGVWWAKIRYDFPQSKENRLAQHLYYVILFSWVITVIEILYTLISQTIQFCRKNLSKILNSVSILLGLTIFILFCCETAFSSSSKCDKIHEVGFSPANESDAYKKWFDKQTKGMDENQTAAFIANLPDMRCYKPHRLLVFFWILISAGIIVIIVGICQAACCPFGECNKSSSNNDKAVTEQQLNVDNSNGPDPEKPAEPEKPKEQPKEAPKPAAQEKPKDKLKEGLIESTYEEPKKPEPAPQPQPVQEPSKPEPVKEEPKKESKKDKPKSKKKESKPKDGDDGSDYSSYSYYYSDSK